MSSSLSLARNRARLYQMSERWQRESVFFNDGFRLISEEACTDRPLYINKKFRICEQNCSCLCTVLFRGFESCAFRSGFDCIWNVGTSFISLFSWTQIWKPQGLWFISTLHHSVIRHTLESLSSTSCEGQSCNDISHLMVSVCTLPATIKIFLK